MTTLMNRLQSIDTRLGIVGTELHLTAALCDAVHTSQTRDDLAHTPELDGNLLQWLTSKINSKRTERTTKRQDYS